MKKTVLIVAVLVISWLLQGTARAGTNVWTSIGPDGGSIAAVSIDPWNPNTLYAGTHAGSFKSADGGASWMKSPMDPPSPATPPGIVVRPKDGEIIRIARKHWVALKKQPSRNELLLCIMSRSANSSREMAAFAGQTDPKTKNVLRTALKSDSGTSLSFQDYNVALLKLRRSKDTLRLTCKAAKVALSSADLHRAGSVAAFTARQRIPASLERDNR